MLDKGAECMGKDSCLRFIYLKGDEMISASPFKAVYMW